MMMNPLIMSGFTTLRNYPAKKEIIERGWRLNAKAMSPADKKVLGKRLVSKTGQDVFGYKSGTEITPEIREDLINKGIDSINTMPTWKWTDWAAATTMAAGNAGKKLTLLKGLSLLKGSRVLKGSKLLKFLKLGKFAKGAKVIPVVGLALGALADGLDAYYHTSWFNEDASHRMDAELEDYLKSTFDDPNWVSAVKNIGSIAWSPIDAGPLRNRLITWWGRLRGNTAWEMSKLRPLIDAKAIREKEAAAFKDLNRLLPGMGGPHLEYLATMIGQNRFETARGKFAGDPDHPERDSYTRPTTEFEREVLSKLEGADAAMRPLLSDLAREAGGDAVRFTFFTKDAYGNPVIDPGVRPILAKAAKAGKRFQSIELKGPSRYPKPGQKPPSVYEIDEWGVRYHDPRYQDPDEQKLRAAQRRILAETRAVEKAKAESVAREQAQRLEEKRTLQLQREKELDAQIERQRAEIERQQAQEVERRRAAFKATMEQKERSAAAWRRQMERISGIPEEAPAAPQAAATPAPVVQPPAVPEPPAPTEVETPVPTGKPVPQVDVHTQGYADWIQSQVGG
jgi:regulator of protease activity HflC (stomatin/prohibitin superfamily)